MFAQSRLSTEVLLSTIKRLVEDRTGDAGIVRGYRGGYLPLRRREVEQGLRSGDVLGVVATSALELGIDIGHLDVAVLAGFPGTIASLWQQSGRAGRRSGPSAAVLVASSAPMDQFLASHPEYLFGASPEHARINPENPFILVNHLKCGAFELPFAEGEVFGGDVAAPLAALEAEGLLHRAGGVYHWTSETYPADHISLRTVTSDNFLVIDTTARDAKEVKRRQIIAEVDWKSAFAMVYPKAIYMVESEPFEVQELHYREDEEKVAYVKRVAVDYFTDAISAKGVWILQHFTRRDAPGWTSEQGEVLVAEKVVGFKKIKMGTLENVGSGEVELPQQEMQTTSAWLAVDPTLLVQISPSREELVDGMRALTYLLHHLAPIFLLCDVRDVGAWLGDGSPAEAGVVVTRETQRAQLLGTERFTPTLYLYDSQPGGIGLAERIFEILPDLLAHGLATLEACPCKSGCPSCVGPVNEVGRRAKPIALRPPPPARSARAERRSVRWPSPPSSARSSAASSERTRTAPARPVRRGTLEELVEGAVEETERGTILVVRRRFPLGQRARRAAARRRSRALRRRVLWPCSRAASCAAPAPRGSSTSTPRPPGSAGGTGTYVFLVGVGLLRRRRLRGAPVLHARPRRGAGAAGRARRARPAASTGFVTYNGSGFDLPLLETRFVLGRRRWPTTPSTSISSPPRAACGARASPIAASAPWSRTCSASTGGDDLPGALIPAVVLRVSPPQAAGRAPARLRAQPPRHPLARRPDRVGRARGGPARAGRGAGAG